MQRLYFLVPDVGLARNIIDELLDHDVPERQIHVVARDHDALEAAELPEAGLLDESEFIPALERGLAFGGATGLLAGITALTFPPAGLVLGGGAILATSVLGAGVGAWIAGMVGASLPNTQLDRFQDALDAGQILMLVDVPKPRAEAIAELIRSQHPEVKMQDTTTPAVK